MNKKTKVAMLILAGSTAMGNANPAAAPAPLPPSIGKTMLKPLGTRSLTEPCC